MARTRTETFVSLLLGVAIVLTLSLLSVAVYRGWDEESMWHYGHQEGGSLHIANITINLGGVPKQEHCQTCHPEGKPAALQGRSVKSSRHPDITPHSIYDLGCTGCHLGEGMAADLKISHGRIGNEVRKVLSGEAVQSACYRCHEVWSLKGAEKAWEGARLFSENACGLCHATGETNGAIYGPALSDTGSFLSLAQIRKAIEDPKEALENSIMPKFSLSPEEVTATTYFLKSLTKDPFYETPMTRMARKSALERWREIAPAENVLFGKEMLRAKKCLACHKFGETDGQIAPDLTYAAHMRKRGYVANFLKSPGWGIPGAMMPVVPLDREEEIEIVRSLQEKRPIHLHGGNSPKNIYMMLCQRCHAAEGDGFGTIQPNLANFPRPFRDNKEFFRSISDERILQSIEKGIPGTSMPPYEGMFARDRVNSLADLLFQVFIRTGRSDKSAFTVPKRPAVLPSREKGQVLFKKECSRCHGVQGKGRGPEYLKHLPRPRDLTNQPYFASVSDDRVATAIFHGVPGTAMGAYGRKLSSESIWALAGIVRDFCARGRDGDDE